MGKAVHGVRSDEARPRSISRAPEVHVILLVHKESTANPKYLSVAILHFNWGISKIAIDRGKTKGNPFSMDYLEMRVVKVLLSRTQHPKTPQVWECHWANVVGREGWSRGSAEGLQANGNHRKALPAGRTGVRHQIGASVVGRRGTPLTKGGPAYNSTTNSLLESSR